MSSSFTASSSQASTQTDTSSWPDWVTPFFDGSCGPNLEYDNEFLALQQAAVGRPETQFEAALPPDWHAVEAGSLQLLTRSRDLRLVVYWFEAQLKLQGFQCLAQGFNAMACLVENAWPTLNPPLDEGDPYARLNVIESLGAGGSFFLSLRNCKVVHHSKIGEIQLKDFEAAAAHSESNPSSFQRGQIEQFLASTEGRALDLQRLVHSAQAAIQRLLNALGAHVHSNDLPQLQEVKKLLACLQYCLPSSSQAAALLPGLSGLSSPTALQVGHGPSACSTGVLPVIDSRDQALAALRSVCHYLEKAEPTNPAPLLLHRACQLMNQPFLQLIRNLAPDALADVAKIMGINPDSLEQRDQ